MNREIKFRGKQIENGQEWVCGSLIQYPGGKAVIVTFDPDGIELSYDVDPDTLGQSTGLSDRHGRDIHEGDILLKSYPFGGRYTVRWNDYAKSFILKADTAGTEFLAAQDFTPDTFEVIGNIHDNPELLKGGRQ